MQKISSYMIKVEVQLWNFNLNSFSRLELNSHVQVYWIFWEIFFFFNKNLKNGQSIGSDAIALNFSKELDSTDSTDHADFGEIRFLKWNDVINLNSWFLAILKGFSECLPLFKLTFFLKIKKDFNKNRYFMCQI